MSASKAKDPVGFIFVHQGLAQCLGHRQASYHFVDSSPKGLVEKEPTNKRCSDMIKRKKNKDAFKKGVIFRNGWRPRLGDKSDTSFHRVQMVYQVLA